jgi:hypothetical protein
MSLSLSDICWETRLAAGSTDEPEFGDAAHRQIHAGVVSLEVLQPRFRAIVMDVRRIPQGEKHVHVQKVNHGPEPRSSS